MRILLVCLCLILGQTALAVNAPTVPGTIVFAGLNLTLTEKARQKVQTEVDALTRNPKYFQIKVDRLQIYFPIIERIFVEEGLPQDFKYLVLQESALISDAVSSSNAVGFWQFKKAAAEEVGLRVERNIDERLNIVASTRGAARYIKKNNRLYFDNWVHALLAYQQGPGGAQRLVNKKYQGSRSMPIDSRTHWYVIKFLAHKIAFEQVKSATPKLHLLEYYEGQGKTLKEIAQVKSLDYELVSKYNKWLKKGQVPADKPYAVILPYQDGSGLLFTSSKSPAARKSSAVSVATPLIEYETHPTKYPIIKSYKSSSKGLKVNGIKAARVSQDMDLVSWSQAIGVSVKRLLYYNDVKPNKRPRRGEIWYLRPKKPKASEAYHIVEQGENLWTISQKYGIRLSKLRKKNHIPKTQTTVKTGRVLWLNTTRPEGTGPAYINIETTQGNPPPSRETTTLTQQKTVEQTENSSNLQPEPHQRPLPKVEEPPESVHETLNQVKQEAPEKIVKPVQMVHEVQAGETLYGISKEYGVSIADLRAWNQLESSTILSVGQPLKVSAAGGTSSDETSPSEAEETGFVLHRVQQGETLYQIARHYQTTIKQLMEMNGKTDFNLAIGEELKVPADL